MSRFLAEALGIVGGAGALILVLAWLARTLMAQLLQKDLEIFKAKLAADTSLNIEAFKAQLASRLKEQSTRFDVLHQKRADVIAELYDRLDQAYWSASFLNALLQAREDETVDDQRISRFANTFSGECVELVRFIKRHQLYFGVPLAKKIAAIMSDIQAPLNWLVLGVGDEAERQIYFTAYWEKNGDEIAQTIQLVETAFRELLGSASE